MTLQEWIDSTGLAVRPFVPTDATTGRPSGPATDARTVPAVSVWGLCGMSQWNLHHLSDYVVTNQTGGTFWLVPR